MGASWFNRSALVAVLGLVALAATAADRQRIEREADIPRFSYSVDTPLDKVVVDPVLFDRLMVKIRSDIESVLEHYDLSDKSAERSRLGTLAQLDFLAANYDAALAKAEKIRSLEEKPADKLLSGLRLRAMANAARQGLVLNSPEYAQRVGQLIRQELDGLPFEVIANDIRSEKARAEFLGEGRVMGMVHDDLQATVNKTGSLSSDLTPQLISARYVLQALLPLKPTLVDTFTAYLDQHRVQKKDIWSARDVVLPAKGPYHTVRIAVWDSGVDAQLYPSQLLKGPDGQPVMIAFDLASRRTHGQLYPIPSAVRTLLPELLSYEKGFSDATSDIDSREAAAVKKYISELKPEEFKTKMEQISLVGDYSHGTHVAGIALAGNPWARLAIARISFDYKLQPDPCPSLELSERSAQSHLDVVKFLKKNKIRVVNMSWGGNVKGYEESLEKCGIGKDTVERGKLARQYFEIEKKALTRAILGAPGVLFVTSAGNSNSDASFDESIPSSIVAPNLLTVGAVDIAGDEAGFTSYGPTVAVHANGYQVVSYLPGGSRVALSGTSMASPNVTNLAAKLLAIQPSLKPAQVIALIRDTAETTPDGRRHLIDPAKAVAKLTKH